ncbi:MAG: TetR/AcrR family transcriptional regulator [Alcanivorax sp.]|nr:TetR/AcrR family transcriptional regulator [Alcanivorax sp.]
MTEPGHQELVAGVRRRVHKPADERRAEILAAASKIFAAHGYRATDVQLIADAADVGKGTVYRFFATKEALFLGTMADVMERLSGDVDQQLAGLTDPWEALCTAIRTYFAFFQRHPEAVELFIHERAEFRDRSLPTYFAHSERRQARWLHLFRELGLSQHTWPTPEIAMDILGDLAFGAIFVNPLLSRRPSLTTRAEHVIRFMASTLGREHDTES